jgi:hypothetical protein
MASLIDYPIALIPIVVVSFFVILVIIVSLRSRRKLRNVFNKIAIKRNGEITNIFGGLGYPVLKFYYNSNQVKVLSLPGSKHSPPRTIVNVEISSPLYNSYMHLYKEGFASRIGKKFGTQDIEIGLDSFDKDIMIKGSDDVFVRNILTYEIQDLALKIIKNHKASIRLMNNKLEVIVLKMIFDEFIYEELINTALRITDRIQGRK